MKIRKGFWKILLKRIYFKNLVKELEKELKYKVKDYVREKRRKLYNEFKRFNIWLREILGRKRKMVRNFWRKYFRSEEYEFLNWKK